MKQLLLLFVAMLHLTAASAHDLTDDKGLYYNIKSDGTLEVVGLATSATKADILSSVTFSGKKYRVTSIGERAFDGRSDLTYLSIPYSVKSIGKYAFINCGKKISVNIADPESWCQMELGNEHSSPLSSAGKLLIHDIETNQVDIPKSVTSINAFTFYQCSCIKTLSIPASVKSIGSSAFEDCDNLTSLNLNEGLESIGGSAFEGCTKLKTLSIPGTVTQIKINAFKNCTSITDVFCLATKVPTTDNKAFDGTPTKQATLHIPLSAYDAYKTTSPWNNFFNYTIVSASSDIIIGILGYRLNHEKKTAEVARCEKNMVSVEIPSTVTYGNVTYTVTSIGANAFFDLTIGSLTIPSTITNIDYYAFDECMGLNPVKSYMVNPPTINLPGWVTGASTLYVPEGSLEKYKATEAWKNFKEIITFNDDVTEAVINNIRYRVNHKTKQAEVARCEKNNISVELPSTIKVDGVTYTVTSIGAYAFFDLTIGSLTIPATITNIDKKAFDECIGLNPIKSYIENPPYADFPYYVVDNSTLYVPEGCLDKYKAVESWKSFKHITTFNDDVTEEVVNNIRYRVNHKTKMAEVARCEKNNISVELPSTIKVDGVTYTVTSIGAYAFFDLTIGSLTIPATITNIDKKAFDECIGLNPIKSYIENPPYADFPYYVVDNSTLYVPEGCLDKYKAVESWKSFKHITTFNDDVTEEVVNNIRYRVNHKTKQAEVARCEIKNVNAAVELPSTIKVDGVTYTVTSIGANAFFDLTIGSLTIPSTITNIDKTAFDECMGLDPITSFMENPPYAYFPYWIVDNSTLYVPEGCVDKYKAVETWKNFKKIYSMNELKKHSIDGLVYIIKENEGLELTGMDKSIKKVDIPSSVTIDGTKYPVTSIAERAFEGRNDITYLSIPYSIKSIGAYAFINCGSEMTVNISDPEAWCQMKLGNEHSSPLSSAKKLMVYDVETDRIDIPKGVTSIGNFTFYQCSCITALTIPSTVESIGSSAFEDCDYLTSLSLSEGLETIGGSAFEGCKRLKSLSIPSTVTSIKLNAFKNCTGLEQVDCFAETVPELGENAFEGVWNKATLRVPYTVEGKYLKTSPWNQFGNITHLPYITYVIDGEVYDKVYVPFGTIIITPKVEDREGYEFSWGEYPKTMPDEDVTINGSYTPTAINGIKAEAGEAEIYSINGYRTSKLQRGLNIIRQQDGKIKKVMVR